MKQVKIFCDGCSRGNPGPAGIGYVITTSSGEILAEESEFIEIKTNNEAEYLAAIKALEKALSLDVDEVDLYADSELLIKQIRGEYQVRSANIRKLYLRLRSLISRLKRFQAHHVMRDENLKADDLANKAVDEWIKKSGKIVKFSLNAARFAGELVRKGGVIIFPTDTVYGVGCDPMNETAVERVKQAKGRASKPFPILVDSLEKALELGEFEEKSLELAYRLWPGPLTIVVKASEKARESPAIFGSEMIGLRIPASIQAIELIKRSGGALVGTSANLSGNPPPKSMDELEDPLIQSADLVIDGGRCPLGEPSTVIKVSGRIVEILREGALTIERVKSVVEEIGLSLKI